MKSSIVVVFTVFALFLLVALSSTHAQDQQQQQKDDFVVVGYLPEYRLGGFNYTAAFSSGLTHLIFFSLEVGGATGAIKAKDRLPDMAARKSAAAAAKQFGGKILLGFGGNSRSGGFGKMSTNPETRKKFLSNLHKMLEKNQFDGVDYNWEYPRNENEWKGWYDLMKETRELTLKHNGGRPVIVTFTIYLDPNHYKIIREHKLIDVADYVLCMAYDQSREHATIKFYESGIDLAVQHGIPLKKFVNGLPFYARDVRSGEPKTYNQLEGEIERHYADRFNGEVHWTSPFTLDLSKKGNFDMANKHDYYNSRSTLAYKTKMAVDRGIGGVMIWELGQDLQGARIADKERSLLTAVQSQLPSYVAQKKREKEAQKSQPIIDL